MDRQTDMVTGAFSFTGSYIAERLLARGNVVRTLTGHPGRQHTLAGRVEAFAYDFHDEAGLARNLEGVTTFYNTYWVRFPHGGATHETAVANSLRLFSAARRAGVRRFVHVSIANPFPDSPLPYYRGKARLERELMASGLSYAILRPAVLFGPGAILINNIAWLLRRLPVFAIIGDGQYRLQPVYVDDLAALAIELGSGTENVCVDAAGPETYTYRDLVRLIRKTVGSRAPLLRVPAPIGLALGRMLGWALRDVLITREEVAGLLGDLLVSHQTPSCPTRFSEWLRQNGDGVGALYLSELGAHYR